MCIARGRGAACHGRAGLHVRIELNPRAAAIAEVVLWIGYLQWHFRTRGDVSPPVPVIRDLRNIENRDAVLAYDSVEVVTDAAGDALGRSHDEAVAGDGRTHPRRQRPYSRVGRQMRRTDNCSA